MSAEVQVVKQLVDLSNELSRLAMDSLMMMKWDGNACICLSLQQTH
jgi:hypothetical protein